MIAEKAWKGRQAAAHDSYCQLNDPRDNQRSISSRKAYSHPKEDEDQLPGNVTVSPEPSSIIQAKSAGDTSTGLIISFTTQSLNAR